MPDIATKIKQFREKKGLTLAEFSQAIGEKIQRVKDIERGKQRPPADFVAKIVDIFHEDANWFLAAEEAAIYRGGGVDQAYVGLPVYDVHAAAGGGAVIEKEELSDVLMFKRSWLDAELHANAKDLSLIYVEGESMEPTLRAGDIILVDRRDVSAQREGIYVLRADNALLVKRLQRLPGHRLKISSDNPAYQPFELDLKQQADEFAIIGRVVWAGRRM